MTSVRRVFTEKKTVFNPSVSLNWLAGSSLYNSTYAGNKYFDTTTFGNAKLFGADDSYVTDQSMISNGFAYLALNPVLMEINSFVNGGNFVALYDWETRRSVSVVVVTQSVKTAAGISTVFGIFTGEGEVTLEEVRSLENEFSRNIESLQKEFKNDSILENQLENFGYTQFGALGYAAGGIIGGLIDGKNANVGANIAEAVVSEIKGKTINTVLGSFGVANPAVAAVAGLTLGNLLDEAFEIALGLDNHFGFGGEIAGFGDNGEVQYGSLKSSRGVIQNFKDILASVFTIESLGDTFREFDYSEDMISSALDDSLHTKDVDNPDWEPTESDIGWDNGLPTIDERYDHYASHDGGSGDYEHDDFGGMDFGGENE